MNKFVHGMQNEANKTFTENGAFATKSTDNDLLDLFATIGAIRGRSKPEIEHLFSKAFSFNNLLALKMVFYARDVRGGLGEREVPRILFRYLANTHPDILRNNLHLIPYYGRWDDLYCLVGTPLEEDVWLLISNQLVYDSKRMAKGEPISLLAKWLKSVNTSSAESRRLGKLTAYNLGLPERVYRKMLTQLRSHIDVVEQKMSAKYWEGIDYSKVPSYAMKNYREAFKRNDGIRFESFINSLGEGGAKINASTLYPYDVIEAYGLCMDNWSSRLLSTRRAFSRVLEEQWKALPNYVEGENNVLVMADTSGSMAGRPLDTAVGLAIYFAERNKGAFRDVFMTFSSKPSFITLKGDTLYDKVRCIPAIVDNTNLEAAFNLILKVAIDNNVSYDEMPKSLVIVSDMEFDQASGRNSTLFYDKMKGKFASYGYKIPNIVFWNVYSRQNTFHVKSDYVGVQLVSGQSVSTFKGILNSIGKTPYESMLSILNSDRYKDIIV